MWNDLFYHVVSLETSVLKNFVLVSCCVCATLDANRIFKGFDLPS